MEGVRHVMLVERYLGVVTPERVAGLVADTRAAVHMVAASGAAIAYVSSIAIPCEETCFCLFVAESRTAVERVNDALAVPAVQTVSALWTGPRAQPGGQSSR